MAVKITSGFHTDGADQTGARTGKEELNWELSSQSVGWEWASWSPEGCAVRTRREWQRQVTVWKPETPAGGKVDMLFCAQKHVRYLTARKPAYIKKCTTICAPHELRESGGQMSTQGLVIKAGQGWNIGSLEGQDNDTHLPKHRKEPNLEAGTVRAKVSFKFSPMRCLGLSSARVSREGGMA